MENMEIYNQGRAVPQEAQKAFNNGSFSGTDINPMWRIKKLTEIFGPCGFGWKYEIVKFWNETINNEIHTHMLINLYVAKESIWSEAIPGIGGNKSLMQSKNGPKSTDESYKMALTDALSVAAKALGIGADIYFDKDKTKYQVQTENLKEEKAEETKTKVQADVLLINALEDVKAVSSYEELRYVWDKYKHDLGNNIEFKKAVANNPYNKKK